MSPFGPDPDWYENFWYRPDPTPDPPRRIAPVVVAVVCALVAVAGVTLSPHHVPSAPTALHMG